MAHRLLHVVDSGEGQCCDCLWFDKAAAGACLLWGKAMTAGNRIPECLAAEAACTRLIQRAGWTGWNEAIERAVQIVRSAPIPEDIKSVLAIVLGMEKEKEGQA